MKKKDEKTLPWGMLCCRPQHQTHISAASQTGVCLEWLVTHAASRSLATARSGFTLSSQGWIVLNALGKSGKLILAVPSLFQMRQGSLQHVYHGIIHPNDCTNCRVDAQTAGYPCLGSLTDEKMILSMPSSGKTLRSQV